MLFWAKWLILKGLSLGEMFYITLRRFFPHKSNGGRVFPQRQKGRGSY
jgi:hypothetical protein